MVSSDADIPIRCVTIAKSRIIPLPRTPANLLPDLYFQQPLPRRYSPHIFPPSSPAAIWQPRSPGADATRLQPVDTFGQTGLGLYEKPSQPGSTPKEPAGLLNAARKPRGATTPAPSTAAEAVQPGAQSGDGLGTRDATSRLTQRTPTTRRQRQTGLLRRGYYMSMRSLARWRGFGAISALRKFRSRLVAVEVSTGPWRRGLTRASARRRQETESIPTHARRAEFGHVPIRHISPATP